MARASASAPASAPRAERFATLRLVAFLFVAGWLVRTFLVGAYAIPSASMAPQLQPGDYLLVAKWPYGWSRHGLSGGAALLPGSIGARDPTRGDIVVIRAAGSAGRPDTDPPVAPTGDRTVVKRVIGLPGDRVSLRAGTVSIDGRPLPRLRIGDGLIPVRPGQPCRGVRRDAAECRYFRYLEYLPGGRRHVVLDSGPGPLDDYAARVVPPGHLFLLGDNRDDSADSRLDPVDGGLGMVPADHLLGRATILFWATEGTASLDTPRSWWATIKWDRIGLSID